MTYALRHRLILIGFALFIRAAFEVAYAGAVSPSFAYSGFIYFPDPGFGALTYAATFLFALVVPLESSPSKTVVLLFYLLFFVPFGVIASAADKSLIYYLLVCLFTAVLIGVVRYHQVRPLRVGAIPYGREAFVVMAVSGIALTVVLFLGEGGLDYISFDVTAVYEVRWEINEILSGVVGYLSDWSKNVFLPGLFTFALWRRNWTLMAGSLVLFFIFFGITSAKAVIFYPILILMIYFGVRSGRLWLVLCVATTLGVVIPWLLFQYLGQNFFSSTFLLRLFSVPSLDAYRYFEFFEGAEKMFLRNTLIGTPFRTVESEHIALIIGQNTWGYGSETFTNVGVVATAYMHFGWFGMVLFPALMGVALRLLDKLALGRIPLEIATPLTAVIGVQFFSSDLTATLLSHGLIVMYLSLLLIGQDSPGLHAAAEERAGADAGPGAGQVGTAPA